MVQRERHVGEDMSIEMKHDTNISSIENDANRFSHAFRSH